MSDRTLRLLVAAAISMLLVFQVGTLIAGVFGFVWGVAASAIVVLVSVASARLARAGGRGSFWFLLPTLLFTVGPLAMTLWIVLAVQTTWLQRILGLTPFLVGFALPVSVLALVYYELRKRTPDR